MYLCGGGGFDKSVANTIESQDGPHVLTLIVGAARRSSEVRFVLLNNLAANRATGYSDERCSRTPTSITSAMRVTILKSCLR